MLCHTGAPVSSGLALTSTPFFCSRRDRPTLSANAGISVWKFVVGDDFPNFTFSVKVPWIAVPFEVISLTCPALTSLRKNGLYGTRTRDAGSLARELM